VTLQMGQSVLNLRSNRLLQTACKRASTSVNIFVPCTTTKTHSRAFCRVSMCPELHSGGTRNTHLPAPKACNNDGEVDSPVITPSNGSTTRKVRVTTSPPQTPQTKEQNRGTLAQNSLHCCGTHITVVFAEYTTTARLLQFEAVMRLGKSELCYVPFGGTSPWASVLCG
jgi:hypothetical protein